MELEHTLSQLGLTDNEIKTYLCLLKNGSILAGEIAKITKVHRRNIYDILNRLIEKGFVSTVIQNNRSYFQAVNPRKINDILEEQQREFSITLPSLEELYKSAKKSQDIRVFYGREGLKNIFQDQLHDNREVLILGASKSAFEILPFYFKWYDKDRVKKHIKVKIISAEKIAKKIPLAETRIFPKKYSNPLAVNLYKDKTALILWSKEPLVIVIENQEISQSYKKYFDFLWNSSKKV
jgi:sugar-specific transcriptional regulator TrmB